MVGSGSTDADLLGRLRLALAERYAVERVLGQGGSAVVCLAQDLRHSRPVAIKVLRPEIAMLIGRDRFLNEIETVARLQHPLILPLYDSGEADGLLYFVMPYVQGDSLRDLLEREKQLSVEDAVGIARDVASALEFAHARGVIHRDIKPENIMLFGGSAVVADFGIARVLSAAGDPRATEGGLALGTPLYMSPEQAAASGDVDARSDQYALACVLYEMLGGMPPFTGISPSDVLAHHVHQQLRPISELRSSVPPRLALALSRALAKLPADRFAAVADFAAAIGTPSGEHGPVLRRPARWVGAGALLAAALFLVLRARGPQLDPRYYFVPPFEQQDTLAPRLLTADNCAMYLRESLKHWRGLNVVDGLRTADILGREEALPLAVASALRQARMLGAGRLILGTVSREDTLFRVRALLYDVGHPQRALTEQRVLIGRNATTEELAVRFEDLADSLVAATAGERTPTSAPAVFGTRSLDALLALTSADSALYAWNLVLADSGFRTARDRDPGYAYAWLRVAQVAQWRGMEPRSYAADADRALALATHLPSGDSAHAAALAAMGAGRYADACATYRDLTRRAPDDVLAWFGLGDCLARDRAVVRDPASPSGWRFRASYREAIGAFTHALRSAPSVYRVWQGPAYDRLSRMLFTAPDKIRGGRPESPDTGLFGAFPGLDHDTLAFVPYPLPAVQVGSEGTDPPRMADAIGRNRDTLLALTATWIEAFGASPEAWVARARALESSGFVLDRPGGGPSALEAVHRASGLHPSPELRRELEVAEFRLLLKRGEFAAAADAADRISAAHEDTTPSAPLAGVLALRGRIGASATALGEALPDTVLLDTGRPVALAGEVRRQAGRLQAFASFELPADSVRALARQVSQSAASYFPSPQRAAATWAVLRVPLGIAYEVLKDVVRGSGPADGDYVLAWRLRLDAGDTAGVRAAMRAQDARRERIEILPGEVDIEATFNEARIALLLGDTAGATVHLDRSLTALPKLNPRLLDRVPSAAALVRAMALRAELAARAGDRATARHWAQTVRILWRGADPALAPALSRMQELSPGPN